MDSFRAFSANRLFYLHPTWGVAPGYCIARLWRFTRHHRHIQLWNKRNSIPHVTLVEINSIALKEFPIFILKRYALVMLFLIANVTLQGLYV